MIKVKVAPPKCLFHIATQTKNWYTLIEQPSHLALLNIGIYYTLFMFTWALVVATSKAFVVKSKYNYFNLLIGNVQ